MFPRNFKETETFLRNPTSLHHQLRYFATSYNSVSSKAQREHSMTLFLAELLARDASGQSARIIYGFYKRWLIH